MPNACGSNALSRSSIKNPGFWEKPGFWFVSQTGLYALLLYLVRGDRDSPLHLGLHLYNLSKSY
ncbi:MAG: hypothetical protein F6J93_01080 [Oscillatoria sp. SIO1A7]|nr:hypothetical protein [Oscillatoria sp. SIO1A7]